MVQLKLATIAVTARLARWNNGGAGDRETITYTYDAKGAYWVIIIRHGEQWGDGRLRPRRADNQNG